MLPDEINKYLYDIKTSIESIDEYIGTNRSFSKYKADKMLRRAVEREFEIIGEAMNQLNRIDPNLEISSKMLIIGMRNRVIHGYDKIDDELVWGTIVRHLPILMHDISNLLKQ
jgi:uncharacterized protein with HEPN domain